MQSVCLEDWNFRLAIALHRHVKVKQRTQRKLFSLSLLILSHPHHFFGVVWNTFVKIRLMFRLIYHFPLVCFWLEYKLLLVRFVVNLLRWLVSSIAFASSTLLIKFGKYLILSSRLTFVMRNSWKHVTIQLLFTFCNGFFIFLQHWYLAYGSVCWSMMNHRFLLFSSLFSLCFLPLLFYLIIFYLLVKNKQSRMVNQAILWYIEVD